MLPKIVIGSVLILLLAALGTLGVMYHNGDLSLDITQPAAQVAPSDHCGGQAEVAPCVLPPQCNEAPSCGTK